MKMEVMNSINTENGEVLTMAFVNIQPMGDVYSPESALRAGTLFPDIDKPFRIGGKAK